MVKEFRLVGLERVSGNILGKIELIDGTSCSCELFMLSEKKEELFNFCEDNWHDEKTGVITFWGYLAGGVIPYNPHLLSIKQKF